MRRGELYRLRRPPHDPRPSRVYLVVSRPSLIDTAFPTLICAPIFTRHHGLRTQVPVGVDEGLKHESSVHCDELVSLPKSRLTDYVGALSAERMRDVNRALSIALDLEDPAPDA